MCVLRGEVFSESHISIFGFGLKVPSAKPLKFTPRYPFAFAPNLNLVFWASGTLVNLSAPVHGGHAYLAQCESLLIHWPAMWLQVTKPFTPPVYKAAMRREPILQGLSEVIEALGLSVNSQ